jgi:hypothetical protein
MPLSAPGGADLPNAPPRLSRQLTKRQGNVFPRSDASLTGHSLSKALKQIVPLHGAKEGEMRMSRFAAPRLALCVAIAATVSATKPLLSADLGRPQPTAACAAFDTHVMTLIEDHADLADLDPEELVLARNALEDARRACRFGDHTRAFDLYSRIPLASAPVGSFHRIPTR